MGKQHGVLLIGKFCKDAVVCRVVLESSGYRVCLLSSVKEAMAKKDLNRYILALTLGLDQKEIMELKKRNIETWDLSLEKESSRGCPVCSKDLLARINEFFKDLPVD